VSQRQVVVRRGGGPTERKLGELIERLRPGLVLVRWPDGDEEELELRSRHVVVEEGSLKYQQLLDPQVLTERLRDDPVDLIVQLLRESRETMKATEIRQRMVQMELDPEAVDRTWKAAKKRVEEHEHVILTGKPAAYRWTDTPPEPHAKLKALPLTEALALLVDADRPREELAALRESVRSRATDPITNLVAQAVGIELASPPVAAQHLLQRPLGAGVALAAFPTPVLAKLHSGQGRESPDATLGLLACVPRKLRFLDDVDLVSVLGTIQVEQLVKNGLDELDVSTKETRPDLVAAMSSLAENLTRSSDVRHVSPSQLITVMSALPATGKGLSARTQLAHAIAEHVRQWRKGEPPLDQVQFHALADAAARLPLEPRGARVELLAAVHSFSPEITHAAGWWRHVTLRDIIATADGLLQRVWADPVIAQDIIRPLVDTALASATTRRGLAQIVGAPTVVADHVDPAGLRAAWEKVAGTDERARTWLEAIRADEAIPQLEEQLEQSRIAQQVAEQERDLLQAANSELEARADRLERLLSEAHAVSRDMTDQELRQRAIDALRPVVALAIEAETLVAGFKPTNVVFDRIHAIVGAHGLSPIGASGDRVRFDPAVHEAVADQVPPGETVSVLRPGYTWRWKDEEIVMEKALVS
jgi:molecular chaperone GrpE (heat shock protein)